MFYWLSFLAALFSSVKAISAVEKPEVEVSDSYLANVVSLEDLAGRYDAFLLDAYGVFWGSSEVGRSSRGRRCNEISSR